MSTTLRSGVGLTGLASFACAVPAAVAPIMYRFAIEPTPEAPAAIRGETTVGLFQKCKGGDCSSVSWEELPYAACDVSESGAEQRWRGLQVCVVIGMAWGLAAALLSCSRSRTAAWTRLFAFFICSVAYSIATGIAIHFLQYWYFCGGKACSYFKTANPGISCEESVGSGSWLLLVSAGLSFLGMALSAAAIRYHPKRNKDVDAEVDGREGAWSSPYRTGSQPQPSQGRYDPAQTLDQSPSENVRPKSLAPATPADRMSPSGGALWPLPDGHDWQFDQRSGMHWSDSNYLFFERKSGMFYDPSNEMWFDPEANAWVEGRSVSPSPSAAAQPPVAAPAVAQSGQPQPQPTRQEPEPSVVWSSPVVRSGRSTSPAAASAAPAQQQQGRFARSPTLAAGQNRSVTPQREGLVTSPDTASPPAPGRSASREAVSSAAFPLPEGDWVWNADRGLHWSSKEGLFFDRLIGSFFDPDTKEWHDPQTGQWGPTRPSARGRSAQ